MKLQHAFDMFLMDKCAYCSAQTLRYYKENLNRFMYFVQESSGVSEYDADCSMIDRKLVVSYISFLRSMNIKNTSVNTYFRAVKVFLNYCIDEEYVTPDVLRKVKFLRSDQESIVPLYQREVETVDKLFNMKTETGLRNYCIFHLMLDAGFRRSDVVNLRIQDVSFDKNYLMVKGKGDKYRSVLLCPMLKKSLYKYLITFRPYTIGNCEYEEQPFFVQIGSQEYLNGNVIKQLFTRIKKKTGIERLHPHLLRHTFATSYILGGGNLEFLRLMLGHTDYDTTRLYLHLAQQSKMLGADIYKLDAVFFKTVY